MFAFGALAWLDERLLSGVEKLMWRSQSWLGLDMFFWAKVFKKFYIFGIVAYCLLGFMTDWSAPGDSNSVAFLTVFRVFEVGLGWYIWASNTWDFETDPNRLRRMTMSGLSNPNKITRRCVYNRKFWLVWMMVVATIIMNVTFFSVSLLCMVLWMYTMSTDPLPLQPSKLKEFIRSFAGQPVPVNP